MERLTSKVQYKNFEPGEFIDIHERNYDETIKLIEGFPWTTQRDKIVIDLTNPSITIEGKNNDFLKCSVFFNQKYVLHYLDKNQILFTRSFTDLRAAYDYIKKYFESPTFDTTGFKKETTWLKHNLKHFVTKDFRYLLTPKSIRRYLISTSGINFLISITLLFLVLLRYNSIRPVGLLFIWLIILLVGGGIHLILFFGYYNYVKNKLLIMSRGNDIFYFGNIDKPIKYDKKDILQYREIRSHGSRNQFNGFAIIEIEFKDGKNLIIPNLLIDHLDLEEKLFEYRKVEINKFPFLRR